MDAYHPKRRITLSFAGWKGREYVAAAFGGDASLRQRLMQEPGSVANGSAVYMPADGFVPGDFFNYIYTDHINVSRSLIRVRQGKGRKARFTLLSKPLIKKLTEYRELYKPQECLFERLPGEQFTESIVSKRLKAAAQDAGITKRIYPHLLRHSFATHLIEQGTDLKIVKELMGHNSIRTTEIYVHIADTFKSNIKSPLDDILEEDGL